MADHVTVGEVDDDDVFAVGGVEAAEDGVAHAERAHLGFLVVGFYVGW